MRGLQAFTDALSSYASFTYTVSAVPGYLAGPVLLILVLTGRTNYPRWTAVMNPGLLIVLSPFFSGFPAPLGAVVAGGYVNLVFVLFFVVSIITTWKADSD